MSIISSSTLVPDFLIHNSVLRFLIVVNLAAVDFWVVKNITGRKLVGLRWWSEILEDNSEIWRYETMEANYTPHECNSSIFWLG